jgi:H+/Cl- antiporter ClcA
VRFLLIMVCVVGVFGGLIGILYLIGVVLIIHCHKYHLQRGLSPTQMHIHICRYVQ